MARKTTIELFDDLVGGPADETVRFGLDGAPYEIDLTAENATRLREVLAPFITAGRRATMAGSPPAVRRNTGAPRTVRDLADVRAWARANGHTVSARGRVAADILAAYDQNHGAAA